MMRFLRNVWLGVRLAVLAFMAQFIGRRDDSTVQQAMGAWCREFERQQRKTTPPDADYLKPKKGDVIIRPDGSRFVYGKEPERTSE